MDEKKHPTQSQSKPESQKDTELQSSSVRPTAVKRVISKRWLYPALYLGAAALIIGLVYAKSQMSSSPTVSTGESDTGSTQTAQAAESFVWPVAAGIKYQVSLGFFPEKGTAQEQAKYLVEYDNTYYPHQGMDIKSSQGAAFDVAAALSGKVTGVAKDPLRGTTVTVQSNKGYVEKYESLGSVSVKQGDEMKQGTIIGKSGTCEMEKSQGNHLYFEVEQNSKLVDPATVLPKQ
jgi:stage II sporulation protein Q